MVTSTAKLSLFGANLIYDVTISIISWCPKKKNKTETTKAMVDYICTDSNNITYHRKSYIYNVKYFQYVEEKIVNTTTDDKLNTGNHSMIWEAKPETVLHFSNTSVLLLSTKMILYFSAVCRIYFIFWLCSFTHRIIFLCPPQWQPFFFCLSALPNDDRLFLMILHIPSL